MIAAVLAWVKGECSIFMQYDGILYMCKTSGDQGDNKVLHTI